MREGKDYIQFENLSKPERINLILEGGVLEGKRFALSSNPEIQERLKNIRKIVEELKKDYPEIVSLGLRGSLVKGYANTMSDIDAVLFIDPSKITQWDRKGNDMYYRNRVEDHLKEVWQMKSDIAILALSKEDIVRVCHEKDFRPKQLFALFWLYIGKEVYEYRKCVLEELEKMRDKGRERWKIIMEYLWSKESIGLPDAIMQKRRSLYPQTLKRGREVFL